MHKNLKARAAIKYRIRHFIMALPYHFLVMGSVFLIATLFDKYIEAICFLIAFFSLRYKFPTTYHSDSIAVCMTLTISIFGVSIIICPPIYMYLLVSILFAYLDCFLLWFIKDRLDLRDEKDRLLHLTMELETELKKGEKSEEDLLLEKCAKANLSSRDIMVAKMYLLERKRPKEIWKWLCNNNENVEYDYVYLLLNRINKKLKAVS